MTDLKLTINRVSKILEEMERRRLKLSKAIRKIGHTEFHIGNLTQDTIVNNVKPKTVSGKFAGVDGGLLMKSFHGIDLIVTRAVSVIFDYEKSQLKNSNYIRTEPSVIEFESGSPSELALVAGLQRTVVELSVALQTLDKNPEYLLLDGSIVPHPSTTGAKHSHRLLYLRMIKMYDELIKRAQEQNCIVIGVVEDSKSKYFSNTLKDIIVPNLPPESRALFTDIQSFRDTAVLFDALLHNQRTFTFKLSKCPAVKYGKNLYGFYLKTAKYDRPIRLEFVSDSPKEINNRIAQSVLGLSTFSSYGIPSVIIEADARAKLTKYYMEYIERLLGKTTPLLMKLRREVRPI